MMFRGQLLYFKYNKLYNLIKLSSCIYTSNYICYICIVYNGTSVCIFKNTTEKRGISMEKDKTIEHVVVKKDAFNDHENMKKEIKIMIDAPIKDKHIKHVYFFLKKVLKLSEYT